MKHLLLFGIAAVAGVATSSWAADEWPMFRGPNGSGVSETAKPPVEFGPEKNVLWKAEVPWSPSSPCVSHDRIFLTTFSEGGLQTRCYSGSNGNLVWAKTAKPAQVEEYHTSDGSPASSTPATDGRVVVSYFGSLGVLAYSIDGSELWRYDLPLAQTMGGYGSGTSPLIAGDRVIINRDVQTNSSLICLNLKTGKKEWESPRPDARTSYGTPILWKDNGHDQVITPGALVLKAYDVNTGKNRWMLEGVTHVACTTPVIGEGMLYFAGWAPGKTDDPWPAWDDFLKQYDKNKDGFISEEDIGPKHWSYLKGLDLDADGKITKADYDVLVSFTAKGQNVLVAVKPGGTGDITSTHVAWKATRGLPYVPSPIYLKGRVYLVKDGGIVSCFDAKTGNAIWDQERLPASGSYYASPVAADGKLYLAAMDGKVTVLSASGDKPQVLGEAAFGEKIEATPALVGNRLYLRTATKLYALGTSL
jgi:outer membrane protein assembly factor BamB